MNDRETTIALAALRAYAKKGVRRTTMTDVAQEAGVTRQTVYNAFANTDGVLRAAVRAYVAHLWQAVQDGWENAESLEDKLDVLLQHFAVEPWEYLSSSETAAELEGGYNAAGRAELDAAREVFHQDIAALFAPCEAHLLASGSSPLAVAEYISAAVEGIKRNSQTRTQMLTAVSTLKASLLALSVVGLKASDQT
jgi:AcrR family transcriptional regulator